MRATPPAAALLENAIVFRGAMQGKHAAVFVKRTYATRFFFFGPNSCFSEQLALIDYDIYNREILITLIRLFNKCKEPINYSYV